MPNLDYDTLNLKPSLTKRERPSVRSQFVNPSIPEPIAFDRAYTESLALNDPLSLTAREQLQKERNVVDEGVRIIGEQFQAGRLQDTGELNNLKDLPVEQQAERVLFMLQEMDLKTVGPRTVALMAALSQYPQSSVTQFDSTYSNIPSGQMSQALEGYRTYKFNQLEADYKDLKEANRASSGWETVGGFTNGELIPFVSVLTRLGVSRDLLNTIKPDAKLGVLGFFTGEVRQEIRNTLAGATPSERRQMIGLMVKSIEDMEKDPKNASWLMKYNVRDVFENILSPEVVLGASSKNGMDRFFGNLEVALGTLATAWLVGKVAPKTIKSMSSAGDAVTAKSVADFTGNHAFTGTYLEKLANSPLGQKFGIDPTEVVVAVSPKPASFIDDIKVLTPGQKVQLDRNEFLQEKILQQTDSLTNIGLNESDKFKTITKILTDLDEADHMEILPAMSTIARLGDDAGVEITTTYGKNSKAGWDNLTDVLNEMKAIDPNLERFEVLRRTADNGVEVVFKDPEDFARTLITGKPPAIDDPVVAGTTRLSELSNDDLIALSTTDDLVLKGLIEKEATRRAGTYVPKEEYFLRTKQQRYWHTVDKHAFEPDAITNTGVFPRAFVPPNRKFGPEIYGETLSAFLREGTIVRDLQEIAKPFFKMSAKDSNAVWGIFEWSEDFAKRQGRAPSATDIFAEFTEVTPKQFSGLMSLRYMHDTMWTVLNRKLYREFNVLGYKTAKPVASGLPTFHGVPLSREAAGKKATVFDPVKQELRKLTDADIEAVYNDGGVLLKNDLAIDVTQKQKADLILVDGNDYKIGNLSASPLKYHPGYHIRLYEDPYFIVKVTKNGTLNGRPSEQAFEQAVRTSPSKLDAENYLVRGSNVKNGDQWVSTADNDVSFKVVRGRDLTVTESTLMQKQTIQQEGRLFWDERNFDRLPDTTNSPAKLEDPVKAVEAGIGMFARQVTTEDLLKRLKNGWIDEFGDLVPAIDIKTQPLDNVVRELRSARRNIADSDTQKRLDKAIELAQYIRAQAGTNEIILPYMRKQVVDLAYTLGRIGEKTPVIGADVILPLSRRLEKYATQMNPVQTMRSVAFNLFMTFRPARQLLLQSAQIGFLAPLDPLYVGSGKLFKDAYLLRSGLASMHKELYEDGFSVVKRAKAMGYSQKEYRKLLKEIDKSGLLESVDLHSYAGGVRRYNKVGSEAKFRTTRQAAVAMRDFAQGIGFNLGERNNLTFTYLMALRRAKTRKGVKSILQFTDEDWKQVTRETSDLALGMIRPNNLGYQEGAMSLPTQFLSFTHKAALSLLGQNPALKKGEPLKILMGTYLLYGANMFGARDYVEQQLRIAGVPELGDKLIPGMGTTLTDLLSAGIIENSFNALMGVMKEDSEDLDFSFLAPGVDIVRMREMQLETLKASPYKAALGPFGSLASRHLQALDFVNYLYGGHTPEISGTEKAAIAIDAILNGTFPAYNDNNKAMIANKLGRWYSGSGEALPLEPGLNAIWARRLLGIPSLEASNYYNMQRMVQVSKEDYRDIVNANKKHFNLLLTSMRKGEITPETMRQQFALAYWMVEDLDPGLRTQALEASILEQVTPGIPSVARQLAEWASEGYLTPELAAEAEAFIDVSVRDPKAKLELKAFIRDALRQTQDSGEHFQSLEERITNGGD